MIDFSLPQYGRSLDSSVIETGLRQLNKGFHFDVGGNLGLMHPFIEDRMGVWFEGRHLVSMDRGIVPEVKIWSRIRVVREVPWSQADREDASIQWQSVPEEPKDLYEEAKAKALRGNDPQYSMSAEGTVRKMTAMAPVEIQGRVVRLGWRHTFEGIIKHGIQGAGRIEIAKQFGVDMMKVPVGAYEDVVAALLEE